MTFTITWGDIYDLIELVYVIMIAVYAFGPYSIICRYAPKSWLVKVLPPERLEDICHRLLIPFLVLSAFHYGFLTAHWPY